MTLRHANRVLIGTIGLVAMGTAMAAWPAQADSADQGVNPAGTQVRQAAPAAAEAMPTGNPIWAIPLSQLAVTRDRPIFSPSRRPPPVAVAAPIYAPPSAPRTAKAEPERPPLTLVGTIAGENDAIAVFVVQGTGTTVRLHTNDNHEGWILRSVQGREATLEKSGASTVMALAPPGGSAEPVTAQASADPPPRKSRR
jgi:general secretion pathway protein N